MGLGRAPVVSLAAHDVRSTTRHPVVSRERWGVGGRWMWVGGGIPVVSLVSRSTAGYRPSSLRDEGRERRERLGGRRWVPGWMQERRPEDGRSAEREGGIHAGLA